MKFLNRKLFLKALKPKYYVPQGQYFWDSFEGMDSFTLPARTSQRKLEAATCRLADVFRLKRPLFVFGDRIAGWSDFGARRRHNAISVASLGEAIALVREHGHFRDNDAFVDNYYICDGTFCWFVVFCHENDWHVYVTRQQSRRPRFVAWANDNGVRQI